MSFELIPPSRNLSNVQASSKTMDGGAGNTGYFNREGEEESSPHLNEQQSDTFVKSTKENSSEEIGFMVLILRFIEKMLYSLKEKFLSR